MLPAQFHKTIAQDCIDYSKPFANASYVTDSLRELEPEIVAKGLLFAGELGLDPGIDHMSAMETIHSLKAKGAIIHSFTSFTGGLVAPESDNNPWHYKISWNPRNIVLAGNGMAQYKEAGRVIYVPYHQLFTQTWKLTIDPYGEYEGYPNRDSLHYEDLYELHGIQTLLRGTIRAKGFCEAWNILVQAGYTDDQFKINTNEINLKQITESFIPADMNYITIQDLDRILGVKVSNEALNCLKWLDLHEDVFLNKGDMTPAQILELVLVNKWRMESNDKDMVIMQHRFEYTLNNENYVMTSTLHDIGIDQQHTSMSKLVGLPLAIYVKQYLLGKIKGSGFKIPVHPNIYEPILKELSEMGIKFIEDVRKIQ
jgi:saccharopine dehydrogenase (NADP+, L-glutamate forming)